MMNEGPPPSRPIYVTAEEYAWLVAEFLPDLPDHIVNTPQPRTLYGRPLILVDELAPVNK